MLESRPMANTVPSRVIWEKFSNLWADEGGFKLLL